MFAESARILRENEIDLRAFILVKPPFMREEEAVEWAVRSLEFAFECGATAATLIPTRGGNGAMEELAAAGEFLAAALRTLGRRHSSEAFCLTRDESLLISGTRRHGRDAMRCRGRRIARLQDDES